MNIKRNAYLGSCVIQVSAVSMMNKEVLNLVDLSVAAVYLWLTTRSNLMLLNWTLRALVCHKLILL